MSVIQRYAGIHVPLPKSSVEFSASDQPAAVIEKIDSLFEEIVSGYPPETRRLISDMYHAGTAVFGTPRLIEENHAFSQWYLYPDEDCAEGTHIVA